VPTLGRTQRVVRRTSVFVVVALMGGVTTTVMDVVHVVAVRDGDMPTPLGMHMVMPLMNAVLADLTFVVVAIVDFVQVSIVDIVDMVAVRDGDMPTPLTMGVVMANVLFVRRCHLDPSSRSRRESRFSSRHLPILGHAYIFIHCIFRDAGTAIPKERNRDEITAIWASVSSGASATAAIELLASDPRIWIEAGE
jgi:hypothetical protein